MTNLAEKPNAEIASTVVSSMTGQEVIEISRIATGDQNFVYAATTSESEYVLRMTEAVHMHKFEAAIYWQKRLLPLGVPLAEFIHADLEGQYSPFPALLMLRLPGKDLVNAYPDLSDTDKMNLAREIINIQALVTQLPEGPGFGIADSYEHAHAFKTWYEFLMQRLAFFKDEVQKNGVFKHEQVSKVITIANNMQNSLEAVPATPFLWDASERNVLVENGRITGIVDVYELCFGDPLFVIALTSICLALEKQDTVYADYWTKLLHLDQEALTRLAFYKLFFAVAFMRKHSTKTANSKKVLFDVAILKKLFEQALQTVKT